MPCYYHLPLVSHEGIDLQHFYSLSRLTVKSLNCNSRWLSSEHQKTSWGLCFASLLQSSRVPRSVTLLCFVHFLNSIELYKQNDEQCFVITDVSLCGNKNFCNSEMLYLHGSTCWIRTVSSSWLLNRKHIMYELLVDSHCKHFLNGVFAHTSICTN
jgi:hypothetical protein